MSDATDRKTFLKPTLETVSVTALIEQRGIEVIYENREEFAWVAVPCLWTERISSFHPNGSAARTRGTIHELVVRLALSGIRLFFAGDRRCVAAGKPLCSSGVGPIGADYREHSLVPFTDGAGGFADGALRDFAVGDRFLFNTPGILGRVCATRSRLK